MKEAVFAHISFIAKTDFEEIVSLKLYIGTDADKLLT